MCFRATERSTRAVRRGRQRKFFKVVTASRISNVYGLSTNYAIGGEVVAEGEPNPIGRRTEARMKAGIYVYRQRWAAEVNVRKSPVINPRLGRYTWRKDKVIEVHADPKDLLGADATRACFRKVKVLT